MFRLTEDVTVSLMPLTATSALSCRGTFVRSGAESFTETRIDPRAAADNKIRGPPKPVRRPHSHVEGGNCAGGAGEQALGARSCACEPCLCAGAVSFRADSGRAAADSLLLSFSFAHYLVKLAAATARHCRQNADTAHVPPHAGKGAAEALHPCGGRPRRWGCHRDARGGAAGQLASPPRSSRRAALAGW